MLREQSPPAAWDSASRQSARPVSWCVRRGGVDMHGMGDQALLRLNWLGLICSMKCPGSVVIRTFDAIRELRDAGVVIAGGFHSPMEKECLAFLMRGNQPVIVVQARHLVRPRVPASWRSAIDTGRLLVLSPLGSKVRRTTKASALARNEFIACRAAAVLIPHASPGGQAEAVADYVVRQGKPLFTFPNEENGNLVTRGARWFALQSIKDLVGTRDVSRAT